ncbi:MAG: GGDEF domain-containing protein [Anaerolineaceae bacterium]|nr:GGDEF domain-containing protein [Anaerolineaceae bacterium]
MRISAGNMKTAGTEDMTQQNQNPAEARTAQEPVRRQRVTTSSLRLRTAEKKVALNRSDTQSELLLQSLLELAHLQMQRQQYDQVLKSILEAKPLAKLPEHAFEMAKIHMMMGKINEIFEDYPSALSCFEEAHRLYSLRQDLEPQCGAALMAGRMCEQLELFKKAEQYLLSGVYEAQKHGFLGLLAELYNELVQYYLLVDDSDTAQYYCEKAIQVAESEHDSRNLCNAYGYFARVKLKQDNLARAIRHYRSAIQMARNNRFYQEQCRFSYELGMLFARISHHEEAFACLHGALEISKKENLTQHQVQCLYALSRGYEELHQMKKANMHYLQYENVNYNHEIDTGRQRCHQLENMFNLKRSSTPNHMKVLDNIEIQVEKEAYRVREAELHQQSLIDPRTGFFNWHYFLKLISEEAVFCGQTKRVFSVLLLELDDLGALKAAYPKRELNNLQHYISRILVQQCKETDTLSRNQQNQFAILLPNYNMYQAKQLGQRLQFAIDSRKQLLIEHQLDPITISIGITEYDPEDQSAEEMTARAEQALNIALRQGKSGICLLPRGGS